mmetsp:Transcript_9914/g.38674  ORF Transcript_9914/g.38674 Transcript_9914/m.38674 type:complete len:200 (-) Transcript_9914:606-1205(-)
MTGTRFVFVDGALLVNNEPSSFSERGEPPLTTDTRARPSRAAWTTMSGPPSGFGSFTAGASETNSASMPKTVPGPGVSSGDSNVNGANGHVVPGALASPYLGRFGFRVRDRYRVAVIGDGGNGGGGGLSTAAYAHSTGTLHAPYIVTTSAKSTGLMQKSLKRSHSVSGDTSSMPSSAARASVVGVDNMSPSVDASAAAI